MTYAKEFCKNCGDEVEVMCQQRTGFCCAFCEKEYQRALAAERALNDLENEGGPSD